MYSRGGGPLGRGAGRGGRYLKGRLPEGVGFSAYPGRSSTPMPTAESKGQERMNQLKIWNEAAGGGSGGGKDGGGRLSASGRRSSAGSGSGSIGGAAGKTGSLGERRTDSFKEAKERHSNSFVEEDAKDAGVVEVRKVEEVVGVGGGVGGKGDDRFEDPTESGSEGGSVEDERMQDADEDGDVGDKGKEGTTTVNGVTSAGNGVVGHENNDVAMKNRLEPVKTDLPAPAAQTRPQDAYKENNTHKATTETDGAPKRPKKETGDQEANAASQKEKKRLCCCVLQ